MTRKKIGILFLISLAHFLACILPGALGWDWQTVIVSVISAAAMYLVYHIIVKNMWAAVLVILPFFLLYIPLSIQSKNPLNYPVWMGGVAVSIIAFMMVRFKARLVTFTVSILVLAFLEYFFIYPNYFSFETIDANTKKYVWANYRIVDINNNEIPIEEFKGKVVLFDVWHSACYPCIKEFPEVQDLYDKYKSDPSVKIVSLNYPLERDSGIKPTRLSDKYTYNKMYFLNKEDYENFSGGGMPRTFIMDKNFKCRYVGQLNTEWNVFIGNAKTIINRLKNE